MVLIFIFLARTARPPVLCNALDGVPVYAPPVFWVLIALTGGWPG